MTAEAIRQTPDAIRRLSARAVRAQVAALTWMDDPAKRSLESMLLEFLPRWDAYLHERRLLKFAKGEIVSGDVRADGVMLLSNMLTHLVRNTTATEPGDDREAIVWETTQKLCALILDNLRPGTDR